MGVATEEAQSQNERSPEAVEPEAGVRTPDSSSVRESASERDRLLKEKNELQDLL